MIDQRGGDEVPGAADVRQAMERVLRKAVPGFVIVVENPEGDQLDAHFAKGTALGKLWFHGLMAAIRTLVAWYEKGLTVPSVKLERGGGAEEETGRHGGFPP